jgi:hypothetical protein
MGEYSWFRAGTPEMGKASHRGHGGGIGDWSTDASGWTLVAAVRDATEAAHAERREEKYFLLISMDLIGLRYLYAVSHFGQVHIANGRGG